MNDALLKTSVNMLKQTLHGDQENIWIHSPVLNVDVNVLCLCFVAQWWLYRLTNTLGLFLPEDFKFTEEDKVLTGTDLVYNSSKYILSTWANMKSA